MRRVLWLVVAVAAFGAKLPETVDGRRMVEDVRLLSSAKYQGRMTGTPELDEVAKWIAKQFQKSGLRPAIAEGGAKPGYLQKYTVNTESKLGRKNTLRVAGKDLTVAKDFVPRVFSSTGKAAGGLVFAGYGITSNDHHYDDYSGLDVSGKVVLVLRNEPQDMNDHSVFDGRNRTRHANLETKAINAKLHGAVAMILMNDPVNYPEDNEKLDQFGGGSGAMPVGIPVVQVKATVAEGWFRESKQDLKEIVQGIDRTLTPRGFAFAGGMRAEMDIDLDRVMRPAYNVAAYLPGLTDEYIVIGAHYDHIGLGHQFSMSPSEVPKIHHGADDNASGTAALIELGRYFGRQPKGKRGILLVAFSGEEIGLLGSAHIVANMPMPLEKCAAMINLDMVGRMSEGKFFVAGVGTGTTFQKMLHEVMALAPDLKPDFSDNLNIGGSDHMSFVARQVPTLFFFSGLHADYHRPSDTWEKFSPTSYAALIRVVAATATELVGAPERPVFQRPEVAAAPAGTGGGGSGYGPYFGSVPDFSPVVGGVRLAEIRPGSPADKSGIKGGDILVEFDGKPVGSLEDYTYLLRARKPGDLVQAKVKRLGETLTFSVVLEARK